MSDHSTIEWTDATWNIITGCSVTSPGCKRCYAMKLAGTRLQHHESRVGLTQPSATGPVWTGEVRFNEQWLEQPLQWSRARMMFVCAHGDLFHENVPDDWIDQVFAVMALAPQHTFQVLTKRAARMREYFAHPMRESLIGVQVSRLHLKRTGEPVATWSGLPLSNVWLGVSVEDQERANTRIPDLLMTLAAVRFVSAEPLLGPVDLTYIEVPMNRGGVDVFSALEYDGDPEEDVEFGTAVIDWVIVGGESGPGARPMHPDWARSLRDQCTDAAVPFFFKQWGEWSPGYPEHGNDLEYGTLVDAAQHEWPEGHCSFKVGKKAADRLLDGRTWDQLPERSEHANA